MRYIIVFIGIIIPFTAMADIPISDKMSASGDARLGYFNSHRTDRDGSKSTNIQWRSRLRVGIGAELSEHWNAKLRFAGRYFSDQDGSDFVWDGSTPKTDGLKAGQSTLDEAYLKYKNKQWTVKFGRMQTKFELDGVAKKSLDRNESPNTDITWTDGIYATYASNSPWKTNIILQRNLSSGPTNVRRKPLNFSASGSRISAMLAFENRSPWNAVVQRGFNISYLPESLLTDGIPGGNTEDYLGLTAKAAAAWKIGENKKRFMLAGEFGFAPNTPTNAALKIDGSGDSSGIALQVSANIFNFIPKHSFGLVYGYVGGGWLLSPDFRNNNTLIEGRYKWQMTKKFKLEGRLRERKDLKQLTAKNQKRSDVDYYIRLTYKLW